MSPQTDPRDAQIAALLGQVRERVHLNPPTQGDKDEHAISWVLGNLNASTNHQTTREVVAAQYYKLQAEKARAQIAALREENARLRQLLRRADTYVETSRRGRECGLHGDIQAALAAAPAAKQKVGE